jgi:hypothetical protein
VCHIGPIRVHSSRRSSRHTCCARQHDARQRAISDTLDENIKQSCCCCFLFKFVLFVFSWFKRTSPFLRHILALTQLQEYQTRTSTVQVQDILRRWPTSIHGIHGEDISTGTPSQHIQRNRRLLSHFIEMNTFPVLLPEPPDRGLPRGR